MRSMADVSIRGYQITFHIILLNISTTRTKKQKQKQKHMNKKQLYRAPHFVLWENYYDYIASVFCINIVQWNHNAYTLTRSRIQFSNSVSKNEIRQFQRFRHWNQHIHPLLAGDKTSAHTRTHMHSYAPCEV